MKYLIEKGFMDDSQKTVSGMTIAKNLEKLPGLTGLVSTLPLLTKPQRFS
jgi:hypothetical protein